MTSFICPSCADAGSIPDTAQDEPSRRAARALRRTLHDSCRGGNWCDCQHKLGGPTGPGMS